MKTWDDGEKNHLVPLKMDLLWEGSHGGTEFCHSVMIWTIF